MNLAISDWFYLWIGIGIAANSFCMIVLSRKHLMNRHIYIRVLHLQVLIDLAILVPTALLVKCVFISNSYVCQSQTVIHLLAYAISTLDLINAYLSISQSYHYFRRVIRKQNEIFVVFFSAPLAFAYFVVIGFQMLLHGFDREITSDAENHDRIRLRRFLTDLLVSNLTSVSVALISSSLHVYVRCFTFIKKRRETTTTTTTHRQIVTGNAKPQPYFAINIIRLAYHYCLMSVLIATEHFGIDRTLTFYILISNIIFGHTFYFLINFMFFKSFRTVTLKIFGLSKNPQTIRISQILELEGSQQREYSANSDNNAQADEMLPPNRTLDDESMRV